MNRQAEAYYSHQAGGSHSQSHGGAAQAHSQQQPANSEAQLEKMYTWLNNLELLAERYASAKSRRVRLEHERQVVIAELQLQAEKEDAIRYKSSVAQEAYARRHDRYKALLVELERAVYVEEKSYRALQKRQWLYEAWRSEMAFSRAQIGRYGSVT